MSRKDNNNEIDNLDSMDEQDFNDQLNDLEDSTGFDDEISEYDDLDDDIEIEEEIVDGDGQPVNLDEEEEEVLADPKGKNLKKDSDKSKKNGGGKSKLILAAAAVTAVGVAGYVMFPQEDTAFPVVTQKVAPTPSIVDSKATKSKNDFGIDNEVSIPAVSSGQDVGIKVSLDNGDLKVADDGLKISALDEDYKNSKDVTGLSLDKGSISSEPKPSNDYGVNQDGLKKIISASISQALSDREDQMKDLKTSISRLEASILGSGSTANDTIKNSNVAALNSKIESLSASLNTLAKASSEPKVVEKIVEVESKAPRLTAIEKEKIIGSRTRLKGYKVISTSVDGDMSIIKSIKPNKTRVSVFFKGESIIVANKGVFKITGIYDSGHLALVGSDWYMDETYEEYVYPRSSFSDQKKSAPKKEPEVVNSAVRDSKESAKPRKMDNGSQVTPYKSAPISFKKVAEGWSLNGIYGGSYLLKTPSGDWVNHMAGDRIDGLGVVGGLSKDEKQLVVGDYVINVQDLP